MSENHAWIKGSLFRWLEKCWCWSWKNYYAAEFGKNMLPRLEKLWFQGWKNYGARVGKIMVTRLEQFYGAEVEKHMLAKCFKQNPTNLIPFYERQVMSRFFLELQQLHVRKRQQQVQSKSKVHFSVGWKNYGGRVETITVQRLGIVWCRGWKNYGENEKITLPRLEQISTPRQSLTNCRIRPY